jgi:hypothetical protein
MQDNLYPDLDTVSLEELGRLVNVISMESAASGSFLMDTRARFNSFFSKADNFFKTLKFDVIGVGKVNPANLIRGVNKAGFVDAGKENVVVPLGFVGLWLPFSNDLYAAVKTSGALPRMLKDYNTCLGDLISNPELLKGASGIPYNNKFEIGLAKAMQDIAATYFNPATETVSRSLSSVLERIADITPVFNNINDASAFDRQNPAVLVTKAVGRAMELSKQLMPLLDDDSAVSKPVREQLISLTYSLAREVEAYSTLLYRLRQFKLSVEDSLDKIKL